MAALSASEVRAAVRGATRAIIDTYREKPETSREDVTEALDAACDAAFSTMVRYGSVTGYTVRDLVETAQPCATIIQVADDDAWVEDDSGLWQGLVYGVLACIAFHSLRNLLYEALRAEGYDTNDEYPFKSGGAENG